MAEKDRSVKPRELVMFCRQFAAMSSAGVSLLRTLQVLRQQLEDGRLKDILFGIEKEMRMGRSLADALANYPTVFSPMFINMVHQGEKEGVLDEVMLKLAEYLEREMDVGLMPGLNSASTMRLDMDFIFEKMRPLMVKVAFSFGIITLGVAALWYATLLGYTDKKLLAPNLLLLIGLLVMVLTLIFQRFKPPTVARCSFCGRAEQQAGMLLPGWGGVWICEDCVARSTQMLRERRRMESEAAKAEAPLKEKKEAYDEASEELVPVEDGVQFLDDEEEESR